MRIELPAKYLEAALAAVSKDETRYYLRGVFVDPRGFIAATNGHIAFAAKCPSAKDCTGFNALPNNPGTLDGIIIPQDTVAGAIKGKGGDVVLERDTNGLFWLSCGNVRIHFVPIDGSFPDWQRVIPEQPETLVAAHYQPQYVSALGKMAQSVCGGKKDKASSFLINQSGEGPAPVTFPDIDCVAVIMPMHGDSLKSFNKGAFFA